MPLRNRAGCSNTFTSGEDAVAKKHPTLYHNTTAILIPLLSTILGYFARFRRTNPPLPTKINKLAIMLPRIIHNTDISLPLFWFLRFSCLPYSNPLLLISQKRKNTSGTVTNYTYLQKLVAGNDMSHLDFLLYKELVELIPQIIATSQTCLQREIDKNVHDPAHTGI